MRRRVYPMKVALAATIVLAAGVAVLFTRDHKVGQLLESRPASAAPTAPLPVTRLVAPPGHHIANGTDPLTVTLSAPVWSG
ncbi:MAG TPA: hypothetical protein VN892_10410, partial [Solirubrobacteraceae bacterium]|nr:hypothetical protein [Solirubrobacteraceae bacterium]